MAPTKRCSKCKVRTPATAEYFYRHRGHRDGLNSSCKICGKDWEKSEKGKRAHRRYVLKKYYNLTEDDYNNLFVAQKGCCDICGTHQSKINRAMDVDHNHQTKQIRGLLCRRCNIRLGYIEEGCWHKKALTYLEKWSSLGPQGVQG